MAAAGKKHNEKSASGPSGRRENVLAYFPRPGQSEFMKRKRMPYVGWAIVIGIAFALLSAGCASVLFQDLHRETRVFSVPLAESDKAWSRVQYYVYTVMGYTNTIQSNSGTIRVTDTAFSRDYNDLTIIRVVKNEKPVITVQFKKMLYGDDDEVKDQVGKMKGRLAELEEYAKTGVLPSVPKY
ncbi:MAG TPA: hypothetical protein PKM65_04180 [Spirochaetota bacterium]|nr:hypothetical protein [Spirochaetota bacterium]HNT10721.1 hypothetical protein [Spirochaetota bacterium]